MVNVHAILVGVWKKKMVAVAACLLVLEMVFVRVMANAVAAVAIALKDILNPTVRATSFLFVQLMPME